MKRLLARLSRIAVFAFILSGLEPQEEELTPQERADLDEALGDALRPDGTIDTKRLIELSRNVDIDELRREIQEGRDDD